MNDTVLSGNATLKKKRQDNYYILNYMDKFQNNYAKWKKADTEEYLQYYFVSMQF